MIFSFFISFFATSFAAIVFLTKKSKSFDYFSVYCTIQSRDWKYIYSLPNYHRCDFHPDGLVVASAPFTGELKLIDKNNAILWSSTEFVHHDLKFTNDKMGILAISSELIQFQRSIMRSDCISRRDLKNKVLFKWCLKDHIKELEQLGFKFEKKYVHEADKFTGLSADYEISHTNSLYEIGPNSRSKTDPAFTEGNYIVNLFTPSLALLILDKKMEKIIWHKKMSEFYYDNNIYSVFGHDFQVTQDGHILAYFNEMKINGTNNATSTFTDLLRINLGFLCCYEPAPLFFSRLAEFDPYTNEIYWIYGNRPEEAFESVTNGAITKLQNSYLFTHITDDGGQAEEITPDGKKIWTYRPETINPKTQKRIILIDLKPMPNDRFLRARNLIMGD